MSNPWYTPELAALRTAYTSLPRGSERNRHRNLYVSKVRTAKRSYIRKLAEKFSSKGGIWRTIKKSNNTNDWKIKIGDNSTNDPSKVANGFKDFFHSKVEGLVKSHNPTEIFSALSDKYKNIPRWDLETCTELEVSKAIDDLKPNMSSGPDNIPGVLLKHVKFEILPLLTETGDIDGDVNGDRGRETGSMTYVCPTSINKTRKNHF